MNSWFPSWPGFNARGSLVLPLPEVHFELLAPTLEFEDLVFTRKREFHATLLDREAGRELRSLELRNEVRPTMRELFEGEDWQWRPADKRWLLHEVKDGVDVHSIIELIDMPGLTRFRHNVGRVHGVRLPPVPAHVTLYVAGDDIGIGLSSNQEFHKLRVRSL